MSTSQWPSLSDPISADEYGNVKHRISQMALQHIGLVALASTLLGLVLNFIVYLARCGQAARFNIPFEYVGVTSQSSLYQVVLYIVAGLFILSLNALGYFVVKNRRDKSPLKYLFMYFVFLTILYMFLFILLIGTVTGWNELLTNVIAGLAISFIFGLLLAFFSSFLALGELVYPWFNSIVDKAISKVTPTARKAGSKKKHNAIQFRRARNKRRDAVIF